MKPYVLGLPHIKLIEAHGSAIEAGRYLALLDRPLNEWEREFINDLFDSRCQKSFTISADRQTTIENKLFKFGLPTSMYLDVCQLVSDGMKPTTAIAQVAGSYHKSPDAVRKAIKHLREQYGDTPDFLI